MQEALEGAGVLSKRRRARVRLLAGASVLMLTLAASVVAALVPGSASGAAKDAARVAAKPSCGKAPVTMNAYVGGRVVIAESLGFETLVHVRVDAAPVAHPEVFDTAPELDRAERPSASEGAFAPPSGTAFVARLPAGTALGDGEPVALAVDTAQLHFFDLDSGAAIT